MAAKKKKIVILGGGIGGLASAYYLSSKPGWRKEYEIHLYQTGWRLGGKCASSRDPAHGGRIEEHGLHVWFGFYENAFATLRSCYDELNRSGGAPYPSVDEAFHSVDDIFLMQKAEAGWQRMEVGMPVHPGTPGVPDGGGVNVGDWDALVSLIELSFRGTGDLPAPASLMAKKVGLPDWLGDIAPGHHLVAPSHWLQQALSKARAHSGPVDKAISDIIADLLRAARRCVQLLLWLLPDTDKWVHKLRLLDVGLTLGIGLLDDDIINKGLLSIDNEEFSAWLLRHGAKPETIAFADVRALYDTFFAYLDGDINRRNVAAGVAVGCALRMGLLYKGHALYEMNAGMGDVVIAPLYEVLKQRGVKFHFFHRVKRLQLDSAKGAIRHVHFGVQATLKKGSYDPLLRPARGMPHWPPAPRYEQLVQGATLKRRGIDLESFWTPWQDVAQKKLAIGPQDRVVLAISLTGLSARRVGETAICDELYEQSQAWRDLIDNIPSVQTQGVQLWLKKTSAELGWVGATPTMVAAPELLDVWADMSHQLEEESWPPRNPPRSVQYFCGPLPGSFLAQYPSTDSSAPEKARQMVYEQTRDWLGTNGSLLWPKGTDPKQPTGLDWKLLYGGKASGPRRLYDQWLRANIDPTERYVLSPAGANLHRMATDQSGFSNLILAGDWIFTTINAGCVEATMMSGMLASRAISGYPQTIAGEKFLQG